LDGTPGVGNREQEIRRQIGNDMIMRQVPDIRAIIAVGNAISGMLLSSEWVF